MSAYHVFTGLDYYPDGGFRDYRGSFPTLEGARYQVKGAVERKECDWWQIVSSQAGHLPLVLIEEGVSWEPPG